MDINTSTEMENIIMRVKQFIQSVFTLDLEKYQLSPVSEQTFLALQSELAEVSLLTGLDYVVEVLNTLTKHRSKMMDEPFLKLFYNELATELSTLISGSVVVEAQPLASSFRKNVIRFTMNDSDKVLLSRIKRERTEVKFDLLNNLLPVVKAITFEGKSIASSIAGRAKIFFDSVHLYSSRKILDVYDSYIQCVYKGVPFTFIVTHNNSEVLKSGIQSYRTIEVEVKLTSAIDQVKTFDEIRKAVDGNLPEMVEMEYEVEIPFAVVDGEGNEKHIFDSVGTISPDKIFYSLFSDLEISVNEFYAIHNLPILSMKLQGVESGADSITATYKVKSNVLSDFAEFEKVLSQLILLGNFYDETFEFDGYRIIFSSKAESNFRFIPRINGKDVLFNESSFISSTTSYFDREAFYGEIEKRVGEDGFEVCNSYYFDDREVIVAKKEGQISLLLCNEVGYEVLGAEDLRWGIALCGAHIPLSANIKERKIEATLRSNALKKYEDVPEIVLLNIHRGGNGRFGMSDIYQTVMETLNLSKDEIENVLVVSSPKGEQIYMSIPERMEELVGKEIGSLTTAFGVLLNGMIQDLKSTAKVGVSVASMSEAIRGADFYTFNVVSVDTDHKVLVTSKFSEVLSGSQIGEFIQKNQSILSKKNKGIFSGRYNKEKTELLKKPKRWVGRRIEKESDVMRM